ncbi:nicotinate-nucleotide--dimethylbenzimidazole phosphoribosyltransferase [Haloprofundus sp. MHR1]|uniref:nicotinate-nucleotide--dimethylbenzimidazole phosphoribosyltransferase n=1 Tax=Haloprofundus sp. MHR1 TaxID=2572921 RepID=UPI0010BEE546|nr:nicotinate-nucleotide--dimethylbenzimidazole phosphoribosyltransferase [Haloprofundus sp. MHR1]
MRLILVAGATDTAKIDGISAAGADSELLAHTPSADLELVEYGSLVRAPELPVSPTGCPTPAAVTRAVRELLDLDFLAVDAGLSVPTGAPTVSVGAKRGRDVREADPVPTAPGSFLAARRLGRTLPDEELVVGETIPGGTTTALGTLRALGEEWTVSSSFPENPMELKSSVVAEGLDASGIDIGEFAYEPLLAVRAMGDPVLAVVAGLVAGALDAGKDVTLGGGTQMLAAAAVVRHEGVTGPLTLATTSYLADDVPALTAAADSLDAELVVTDPGFGERDDALSRYAAGEGKEGAGMGGALLLADRAGELERVAEKTVKVVDAAGGAHGP